MAPRVASDSKLTVKEKGKKMRAKMQGWLFVDLHVKII